MQLARGLAAATVALVVGCGGSKPGPPPFRGIAYVRHFGFGRAEVWVARLDGTGKRRLAERAATPLLSPDGRWVAYAKCFDPGDCRELYLIPTAGGTPRLLAHGVWAQEWSPDSRFLVGTRVRRDFSTSALVKVDLEGQVTEITRLPAGTVSLVPSGKQVCFDIWNGGRPDLYVVDIDGGSARRLTHGGVSLSPVWGTHGIAFTRLVREGRFPNNAWGADEIWRVNPDGSGLQRIAKPPARVLGSGITGLAPALWSRDGSRIVAELTNEFGGPPFAVDASTGRVRRIDSYSYHGHPAGLSRDGRYVLVEDGNVELDRWQRVEVVPFAGGKPTVIARFAGSPSWNR